MPTSPSSESGYYGKINWKIGRLEVTVYYNLTLGEQKQFPCHYCGKNGRLTDVYIVSMAGEDVNQKFSSKSYHWRVALSRLKATCFAGRIVCDSLACEKKLFKDREEAMAAGEGDEKKKRRGDK